MTLDDSPLRIGARKFFDLLVKGSIKEAEEIIVDLNDKHGVVRDIREYLEGLQDFATAIKAGEKPAQYFGRVRMEQRSRKGPALTSGEWKAVTDLQEFYYEHRRNQAL